MGYVVRAIYENGVLRPLQNLNLSEHQQVEITVEADSNANPSKRGSQEEPDPLETIRTATGLSDLAECFDDYRLGDRTP